MSRNFMRVLGALLALAGVVGFVEPGLLGMHLNPVHNGIHLASGLIVLYVALVGSHEAVHSLGLGFGSVYALLGALGFVAPGLVGTLIGHGEGLDSSALAIDNIVHLALGGLFVVVGASSSEHSHGALTQLNLQ